MSPSLSISIMPTPTPEKVGTLVPNSRWPSQTFTTPPSIPSTVRGSQLRIFSASKDFPYRYAPSNHCRRAHLGFTRFSEPRELCPPQLSHNCPTLEDSAVVSGYVRVLDGLTSSQITSSSKLTLIVDLFRDLMFFFQLRIQREKGKRTCRTECRVRYLNY